MDCSFLPLLLSSEHRTWTCLQDHRGSSAVFPLTEEIKISSQPHFAASVLLSCKLVYDGPAALSTPMNEVLHLCNLVVKC